jgi:hypothetical protein
LDCNLIIGIASTELAVGNFTDRNLVGVSGKGLHAVFSEVRISFMSIGVAHCTSRVIFVFFSQVQIDAFHRAF